MIYLAYALLPISSFGFCFVFRKKKIEEEEPLIAEYLFVGGVWKMMVLSSQRIIISLSLEPD